MSCVVVFDTNILISAALSAHGNPFQCLALAKSGKVQSVTCQAILDEFREKLEVKFHYSPARSRATAEQIQQCSQWVTITHALKNATTDPDDNMIVECALVGHATHIITGDRRHLLPLGSYSVPK